MQLIDKLGIEVRYDRGNFRGGLIRYREQDLLYLNRRSDYQTKIATVMSELSKINIPADLRTAEIDSLIGRYGAETSEDET